MGNCICIWANTLTYPQGGGHRWVYLNWALGFKANGFDVIWMEAVEPSTSEEELRALLKSLRNDLGPFGLADRVALQPLHGATISRDILNDLVSLDACRAADLLVNFQYPLPDETLRGYRRTALLDIDPGLLQVWLSEGQISVPEHDFYFTTGETVGTPAAKFPSGGFPWHRTRPCVALEHWPVTPAPAQAAFTTVSNWSTSREWVMFAGQSYHNDKRSGFLPFIDLPRHTSQQLELALCQAADEGLQLADDELEEKRNWEAHGWKIRHSYSVSSTTANYQRYIQQSRGEFSCVKPSCVRLQNAWVSDRTLCYLASGRPAVVQDTGPSQLLTDGQGIFRFKDVAEAARCLERAASDYANQCRLARELAEKFFSAREVAGRLLEVVMG